MIGALLHFSILRQNCANNTRHDLGRNTQTKPYPRHHMQATVTLSLIVIKMKRNQNKTKTKRKHRHTVMKRPGVFTRINRPKPVPKTTLLNETAYWKWWLTLIRYQRALSIGQRIQGICDRVTIWAASWPTATEHIIILNVCKLCSLFCSRFHSTPGCYFFAVKLIDIDQNMLKVLLPASTSNSTAVLNSILIGYIIRFLIIILSTQLW